MDTKVERILDELDREYLCEVEIGSSRVVRVISGPKFTDERSATPTYWITETDTRFGE